MTWASIRALILLCLVLALYLWFRRAWNVMKARQEAVDVAYRQWQEMENSTEQSAEAFSALLARGESIYHQAADMYNETLRHPLNWLPATVMGFRPLMEDGSVVEQ